MHRLMRKNYKTRHALHVALSEVQGQSDDVDMLCQEPRTVLDDVVLQIRYLDKAIRQELREIQGMVHRISNRMPANPAVSATPSSPASTAL
jgi:hypothetical protein